MLADALFAVMRNEMKFASRNKSTRTKIASAVLRSDTVAMLEHAKDALANPKAAASLVDSERCNAGC